MRVAAFLIFCLALLYWASGTAIAYWLLPAFQDSYHYLLIGGGGDFLAGAIAGIALARMVRL